MSDFCELHSHFKGEVCVPCLEESRTQLKFEHDKLREENTVALKRNKELKEDLGGALQDIEGLHGHSKELRERVRELDDWREITEKELREQRATTKSWKRSALRTHSQLTAVKEALGDYLELTDDCCKGDTACIICQHRDWFRSFIKGLTGKIVPLDTHTEALAKLEGR